LQASIFFDEGKSFHLEKLLKQAFV